MSAVRRPLRRTLFVALVRASILAAILATALAYLFYQLGHDRLAQTRGDALIGDYADKLEAQARDWDMHAVQKRTLLDFMRILENPSDRWIRLKAYLTTLSDAPLYAGLSICDASQRLLFEDRIHSPCHALRDTVDGSGLHYFVAPVAGLHVAMDQPLWLGPEGSGHLRLATPLDHAFLWRMRGGEDELFIEYQGRIIAASAGETALDWARPGFQGSLWRDGVRMEQRRIEFPGRVGEAPHLLIQTPVPPPFQPVEAVLLGATLFILIAALWWFSLGRWLGVFLPRAEGLARAAREFAREGWNIDSLRQHYAAILGHGDELDAVAEAGTQMVEAIFQRERQRDQAEAELRAAEQRFREVAEFAGAFVWEMDADNRLHFLSQGAAGVFGRSLNTLIDEDLATFIPAAQRDAFRQQVARMRAADEPFRRLEFDILSGEGGLRRLAWSGLPAGGGAAAGRYRGIAEDITQRMRDAEQLRLADKVFEHSAQAILVTDAQTRIVAVNPAFTTITGYAADEAIGEKPGRFSSGRHDRAFYAALCEKLNATDHWNGELWNRRRNGEEYPIGLSINAVRDRETGAVSHYVAIFSDISEQKASAARIEHLAYHDPLTGLPNRYALNAHLEQALADARRNPQGLALMFIDLDRFKSINDSLGHDVGDQLLITVARRIRESVRESDTVARLGGDEFVVVTKGLATGMEDAAHIAEKIIANLGQPLHLAGHVLYTTPSIGIALYPEDGATVQTLTKNADIAMYHAKESGRNGYRFFNAHMNVAASERLCLESDLHQALARGEFHLRYQPLVEIGSSAVTGVEALIRWHHPELGEILPGRFIPIAEEIGLIDPIGTWVLATACGEVAKWIDGPDLRLAVNLSARQIESPGFVETVRAILDGSGLSPQRLEIEIQESATLAAPEAMIEALVALAAMGVRIAIDDFGSVYSSLAYLKRLPNSRLKIDRAFVKDLEYDPNDVAITEGIIALARSLGQDVTAEGIETPAQLAMLQSFGCREGQGHLLSPPLSIDALRVYLARHAKGA